METFGLTDFNQSSVYFTLLMKLFSPKHLWQHWNNILSLNKQSVIAPWNLRLEDVGMMHASSGEIWLIDRLLKHSIGLEYYRYSHWCLQANCHRLSAETYFHMLRFIIHQIQIREKIWTTICHKNILSDHHSSTNTQDYFASYVPEECAIFLIHSRLSTSRLSSDREATLKW